MFRKLALALGVSAMVAAAAMVSGRASASNGFGNNCNAAVTKAVGKKMACELGLYAQAQKKGVAVDSTKLASCGTKFDRACSKANEKGGCDAAHADCAGKETAADTCAQSLSPSGAFLD
jgi:type IV secretory pathway TrbL component